MILLLDNYDSFTYNLAQYLGELGCQVEVHRNDKITVEGIIRRKPERIVISPGPCTPRRQAFPWSSSSASPGNFRSLACASVIKPLALRLEGKSSALQNSFTAKPARSITMARVFSASWRIPSPRRATTL